jgi:cytochrome c oxidase cbb3-type subunit I/II
MEMQQFYYDNKIVKKFIYATYFWCRMLLDSTSLLLVSFPNMTDGYRQLSYGRLRPLHTNAVIFCSCGNAFLQECTIPTFIKGQECTVIFK